MDNSPRIIVSNNNSSLDSEIEDRRFLLFAFFQDFVRYILFRLRQIIIISFVGISSLGNIFNDIKSWSIRRMYWGRGSLYRSFFHIVVISLTVVSLFVGISSRLNVGNPEESTGLVLATGIIGNSDTFYQAGTTEAIVAQNPNQNPWGETEHKVKDGESLTSIAEYYGVNTATIKWANNLPTDRVMVGQVLVVPELDGVLYEVKKGDTIASIISKIDNANEFDIKELNNLEGPDYALTEGQKIFIPNGIVKPPKVVAARVSTPTVYKFNDPGVSVASGTFINPLTFCPGYRISRGVLPWHTGVDMAKPGGCWINASSGGTVTTAGWASYGQGFHVVIDHGNGFVSYYYHGNGNFAVSAGQQVNAGQRILYMGCTGNCTGTHLHFEMRYNGAVINPANYMSL